MAGVYDSLPCRRQWAHYPRRMTSPSTPLVTFTDLLARYEAFFFDAYGVLNRGDTGVPHAPEAIAHLLANDRAFFVLTNDASRLESSIAQRFARLGMPIPAERIVSSGSLLGEYFQQRRLLGAKCVVLGPPDSEVYVRRAGGEVLPHSEASTLDALVICDDGGYPFLETVNRVLTGLLARLDTGAQVELVLPNPDLIYPSGVHGEVGITSGSIAALFEAVLEQRFPGMGLGFTPLGKPYAPLFLEGIRRAGTSNAVMLGDTFDTDIAGAKNVGLDSAWLATGAARWPAGTVPSARPTWRLDSLRL